GPGAGDARCRGRHCRPFGGAFGPADHAARRSLYRLGAPGRAGHRDPRRRQIFPVAPCRRIHRRGAGEKHARPALRLRQDPYPPFDRISGHRCRRSVAARGREPRGSAHRLYRHQSAAGAACRHRGSVRRSARRPRARRRRCAGARPDHGDEDDVHARPLPPPRRRRAGAPAGHAAIRGLKLKRKIFSPNQVLAASFLGGPMAMVYVLWKNFQTLENPHGMHQILFWGSIFIVALMLFSPLLPNSRLDVVIPFAYPLAAWSLAESFQMSKQAIADSQAYEFQSAWNVVAVSIVFLLAMVVTAVIWYSGLAAIGMI